MKELIALGLIMVSALMNSFGALYFKYASRNISFAIKDVIKNNNLFIGLGFFVLATLLGLPAYRFAELSLLYPFVATSYIWTCLLSVKYLNETMNRLKWGGIIFIIMGVSLIGIGY